MRRCARCHVTDAEVIDIDTGSACHPEPADCRRAVRAVLVQAVENVKASERAKPSTFGSLGAYGGADAVLREFDVLMRRLYDDESTNSAENPTAEPNHG